MVRDLLINCWLSEMHRASTTRKCLYKNQLLWQLAATHNEFSVKITAISGHLYSLNFTHSILNNCMMAHSPTIPVPLPHPFPVSWININILRCSDDPRNTHMNTHVYTHSHKQTYTYWVLLIRPGSDQLLAVKRVLLSNLIHSPINPKDLTQGINQQRSQGQNQFVPKPIL